MDGSGSGRTALADGQGGPPHTRGRLRLPAGLAALLRPGAFRTLLAGQVAGELADGLAQISFAQLVLFSPGRGVTPLALARLLAVTLIPFSLVGPIAGILIDRWDRRRTMRAVSVLRAAIVLASTSAVATHSDIPAYIGAVLLLSSSRFVLAAKGAALPLTVADTQLVPANSTSAVGGAAAAFVGAVAGATFVGIVPAAGLVAASAGYMVAAVFFSRLPPVGGGEAATLLLAGLRRAASELVTGWRAVVHTPAIRRPMATVAAHRLLLGAGFVLLVLVADSRYHLKTPGYGLALAVTGVGAVLGNVSAPHLARRFPIRSLLVAAYLLSATATVVAGFTLGLAELVAGLGVVGFAFQAQKVLADSLIQRAAHDTVRGRVFALYDMAYNVAFVVAALVLAPAWQTGRGHLLVWWVAAGFAVAAATLAWAQRSWPFPARQAATTPRPATTARRWPSRAAALLLGAIPALAFPKPGLWWLAFFGLVPVLCWVRAAPSGREGAVLAWWAGTGFTLVSVYWLLPNIGPFELLLAAGLGALWLPFGRLSWGLLNGGLGWRQVAAAVVVVPCAWLAAEYVRSWSALGGPWDVLGASQWNDLGFLSLAALGGVWLVSLVLVAVNVALACALCPGSTRVTRAGATVLAVVLAASGFAYGALRGPPPVSGHLRVGVVQPGLAGSRTLAVELAGTAALASQHPAVVVWGESSVSTDLARHPAVLRRLETASREARADLLVNEDALQTGPGHQFGPEGHGSAAGAPGGGPGTTGIYKTAVLISPRGPVASYSKMRLVPFGEYIPLRPLLGWLDTFTRAAAVNRKRGTALVVMHPAGTAATLGPLVCFESAFPDMSTHLAADGASVIVVQTSDSTFQQSWAPDQHASLAAVRAVESGRPVVQAALTGVTAAFDAGGHRLAWIGTTSRAAAIVTVPLSAGDTPFVRWGDWVPVAAVCVLLLAALSEVLRRATPLREPGREREPDRRLTEPAAAPVGAHLAPRQRRAGVTVRAPHP